MRRKLAITVVSLFLTACATAEEGDEIAAESAETKTGQSEAALTKPRSGPSYLVTKEDMLDSGWTARGFFPTEWCWQINHIEDFGPRYWEIRRWCDMQEMRGGGEYR